MSRKIRDLDTGLAKLNEAIRYVVLLDKNRRKGDWLLTSVADHIRAAQDETDEALHALRDRTRHEAWMEIGDAAACLMMAIDVLTESDR